MSLREAAQQALEAIERALPHAPPRGEFDALADMADALRAALAEPTCKEGLQVEPVAWRVQRSDGQYELYFLKAAAERAAECYIKRPPVEPLYTAPPQRKPLTEEEMRECFTSTNTCEPLDEGWPGLERFARAIEKAHGIGGDA